MKYFGQAFTALCCFGLGASVVLYQGGHDMFLPMVQYACGAVTGAVVANLP